MTYKAIPIEGYYLIVSDGRYADPAEAIIIEGNYYPPIAQSKSIHPGLPLFDAPWEVDVEKIAKEEFAVDIYEYPDGDIDINEDMRTGFKIGYTKRSETHKWTDEDMNKAFKAGECLEYWKNNNGNLDLKAPLFMNIDEFVQSLQKPMVYEVTLEEEIYEETIRLQPKISNNKVTITSWKEDIHNNISSRP